MVQKVNGAAYPGVWVEKNTAFIKVAFSVNIAALPAADMYLAGTTTVVTGGGSVTGDSTFGVVESAIVQALKFVQSKATILAVSSYNAATASIDVFVGHAEGFFGPETGTPGVGNPVITASINSDIQVSPFAGQVKAKILNAGTSGNTVVGQIVDVVPNSVVAITYGLEFVKFNGTMPVMVAADLQAGPGLAPGSATLPMGGTGYLPIRNGVGA